MSYIDTTKITEITKLVELLNISDSDIEITKQTLLKIYTNSIEHKLKFDILKKNDNFNEIITNCFKITNINGQINKKIKQSNQSNQSNKSNQSNQSNQSKQSSVVKYKCYICRSNLAVVDNQMCNNCFNINLIKRNIRANLEGKISIVTGGRVKIGFETAIKLLECGSKVIVTTRFPADALDRYKSHPKYNEFSHNLIIYAIDLRYMKDIDVFVKYIYDNYEKLDILIHNAAQTIRRPKQFYSHLLTNETKFIESCKLIENSEIINDETYESCESNTVLIPNHENFMNKVFNPLQDCDNLNDFPVGCFDKNNEQIDMRESNTWIKKLGEIDLFECAELLSINTLAPFHMNQQFKSLMTKSNGAYIVNVSSMEGVFNMKKSENHPHTNMAKAALNMMTRTSAQQYSKYNIYMISVDTGWITDEYPIRYDCDNFKKRKIYVPLTNLDGACRILDPVFAYFNGGEPLNGVFLKDYVVSNW